MIRYILKKDNNILQLLFENDKCIEIRCFEDTNAPQVGQIMIASVKDVVKHIGGAFVDIGQDKNAYLSLDDLEHQSYFSKKISNKLLVSGDEIVVQITKEPMGSKPYCVSSRLSIAGKGVVVCADKKKSVNISKKLKDTTKLKQSMDELQSNHTEDHSIIVRTNAENMGEAELIAEAEKLINQLNKLLENANYRTRHSVLYSPASPWLTQIRDTKSALLDKIVTDDQEIYDTIIEYKDELGLNDIEVVLYNDNYSLKNKISLYSIVKDLENRICWMKSGAYLVIEPTEALVSIDVNSGKAEKKKSVEEFYLEINREAAVEAAKQIRFRNLSGVILIDFINMKKDEDRAEITHIMKKEFEKDNLKAVVAGFTKLGLMEITREKKYKPVHQMPIREFVQNG